MSTPMLSALSAPPGWRLSVALPAVAAGLLAVASAGWIGIAVIVVVLAAGCAVLLRWARWPHDVFRAGSSRGDGSPTAGKRIDGPIDDAGGHE